MADLEKQMISLGGSIWETNAVEDRVVDLLAQKYNIPYIMARILALRGVDDVDAFLNPKIVRLMPDPNVLRDMKKAAERIAYAVMNNELIGIIGDYDVDGATSTSIMRMFLRSVGSDALVHIPDRNEGYGPSVKAVDDYKSQGVKVLLTLDCGTTAFDTLEYATDQGLEVIVIDHHEAEVKLPKVFALVNPKRLDEDNDYPYLQYLAACGVVFLTIVAVNRELRNNGFYKDGIKEPDLLQWLDMVALGTVCDVVPLRGLNRAYVAQGLKVMAQRKNVGLTVLSDKSGLEQAPTAFHLGFVLGPRINAGGRVGDADIGNRLLCCQDAAQAEVLAEKLNEFNSLRKDIENEVLLAAIEQVEGQPQEYPIAFVYGENWHQGVVGIVAGKLRERYNVPAFVMSIEPDEVKGSARSIPEIDLGALIIAAKEKGLITKGGGHTMAAGFSLDKDKIAEFRDFVGKYAIEKAGSEAVVPIKKIDAVLDVGGANCDLADCLEQIEPFGQSNPEPVLMLKRVRIIKPTAMGIGHVRCILTSDNGDSIKAVAFRVGDNQIGQAMLSGKDKKYDVCGVLRHDRWGSKQGVVQFVIDDIRECA